MKGHTTVWIPDEYHEKIKQECTPTKRPISNRLAEVIKHGFEYEKFFAEKLGRQPTCQQK